MATLSKFSLDQTS